MDTGRLVGVLATETAGMWHLSLVIDHPADEAVSTMVVGVGSRGWLLWSLGSKVGNLQGRPLGWGSPGVGSMPSQPSFVSRSRGQWGLCLSIYFSVTLALQRAALGLSDHMFQFLHTATLDWCQFCS